MSAPCTSNDRPGWASTVAIIVAILLCLWTICSSLGCAATAANDIAGVKVQLDRAHVELAAVRGDFSVLKAKVDAIHVKVQAIGDVTIGGGSDSVTSMILAVGLIGAVLAYPLGIRPLKHLVLRKRKERREMREERWRNFGGQWQKGRNSEPPPADPLDG
jgi:hypothetical protein